MVIRCGVVGHTGITNTAILGSYQESVSCQFACQFPLSFTQGLTGPSSPSYGEDLMNECLKVFKMPLGNDFVLNIIPRIEA